MNASVKNLPWEGKIYDAGWREARGGVGSVRQPATGDLLASVGIANAADVAEACERADAAQRGWAQLPFDARAEVLRNAARLLKERAGEFVHWNVHECGSIQPKAEWELQATYEQLQMAAALPMQPTGSIFPSSLPGRRNYWLRSPVGVVGVIAPWNFPLLLAMRSVAPALALGNAVVLKPDAQSAITGGILIAQLFEAAGLPAGVLQVLPGGAETGEAVVRDPHTSVISFTGSTAVGRLIGEICGRMLKKVCLELGGNNAIVVLPDADLDAAASNGAWAAFLHQGQICMQAGRHLVHRDVAEAYASKLAERAGKLHAGDPAAGPCHLGPLINDRQAARVRKILDDSIAAGAVARAGGGNTGRLFQATVLTGVTPEMPAFTEEIFGPVAPITVFDTDEEAVALVNQSDYGLAAAIHSRDLPRARRIAEQLRTGMIHINDQTVNNEFHVPFGGLGSSGNGGRFGGPVNLEAFTQSQWISVMDAPITYPF